VPWRIFGFKRYEITMVKALKPRSFNMNTLHPLFLRFLKQGRCGRSRTAKTSLKEI
jgi:hypothetical protein